MAHLYHPVAVKPIPANAILTKDGKRHVATWTARGGKKVVAELTDDRTKCRVKSPTWWIEYTNHAGRRVRAQGFRSREATLQLAAKLEREAEDIRAGRKPRIRDVGVAHMIDFVDLYKDDLESRGLSERQCREVPVELRSVILGAALTTPAAVDPDHLRMWLMAEMRRRDWSFRTLKHRIVRLKTFGNWLVAKKLAAMNPFMDLTCVNAQPDRRHVRRALEHDDLLKLVKAARASTVSVFGMPGEDRAALYLLAAFTGFRAKSLASLTPESIQWNAGLPVRVFSVKNKNKKPHGVPLHADVARELVTWLKTKPAGQPLFTSWKGWYRKGAILIRHDLNAARTAWIEEAGQDQEEREQRARSDRLQYKDIIGEVFDFHSLRVQFASSLARAGVSLTAAQDLLDHCDPKLTSNVYTRWGNAELAGEIAKLPGLRSGVAKTADPNQKPK